MSVTEPAHIPGGLFLFSLDFELHWGVRDHTPLDTAERDRLLIARDVIPKLLALFQEFDVRVTWATVGFLFAKSKVQLLDFLPGVKPCYNNVALDPYTEPIGEGERDDPFHFASDLIDRIQNTPGQEIASHSFSHYYCLEEGQTLESFSEDSRSAVAIARENGMELRSYVFPRNQANPAYLSSLKSAGFTSFRPSPATSALNSMPFHKQRRPYYRLARLADQYWNLLGNHSFLPEPDAQLTPLPSTRYLAPWRLPLQRAEPLRLRRITSALCDAAQRGRAFHLWSHPEDFAPNWQENLCFLRKLLTSYADLRERFSMRSSTMAEAASAIAGLAPSA